MRPRPRSSAPRVRLHRPPLQQQSPCVEALLRHRPAIDRLTVALALFAVLVWLAQLVRWVLA